MKNSGTYLSWIFFWVDLFILGVLYYFGFTSILEMDSTYISHGILSIYLITNYLLYIKCTTKDKSKHEYFTNISWWTSSFLLGMGMFGTIIGFFILSLGLFPANIDLNDTDVLRGILGQLMDGLSIALITTIVGFATSHMLSLKLTLLHRYVDQKFENKEDWSDQQ